jgi:hypothetical protein
MKGSKKCKVPKFYKKCKVPKFYKKCKVPKFYNVEEGDDEDTSNLFLQP